jgi:predicted permease
MSILQDARLAVRRMRRSPLFAVCVVGTLALGVAASTSIYSVVDGVLLKPLPFPDSRALVRVTADYTGLNLREVGISQPELDEFALHSGVFASLTGVWPITANLTGSDRPERVEVLLASSNYFQLLGVRAATGRTFEPADEIAGIATVAVISDALWRRGFGADPQVLGRTLRIDEDVYQIVGIMPPSFRHPSATLETEVEVWVAAGWRAAPFPAPGNSARFIPSAIGRLKGGVSIDEARQRLEALAVRRAADHAEDYPARLGWIPRLQPLAADLVASVRPALLMLMGAIVFVLVISISNISNLLLVRAVERERELAIQRALGASRLRILCSLLVEGAVLAAIGGALGFIGSLWGVDLLLAMVPDRLPRAADIRVDSRVLLFAISTSAVTGLLVGLGPALQSARGGLVERLKATARGLQSGGRARLRSALVVAQVAIALIVLAGAALLVRSLWALERVDTGITTDRLLTARLWLPQPNDPQSGPYFTHASRVVLLRGVLDRLRASPGLAHAAFATALPATRDSGSASIAAEGWPPDRQDLVTATPVAVTPGYFDALGIRLLRGRLLEDKDDERAPRAVVVNETFARTYFADGEPVGRRFRFAGRRGQVAPDAPWISIVGVVRDAREDGLDVPVRPQIYQSLWQVSNLGLVIFAAGQSALPAEAALREAVLGVDPNLPVYAVRSGRDLLSAQLAPRRFATRLINAFAAAALVLAAFGLHGMMTYGVRQRTHEIGVRIALGASTMGVVTLVLGHAGRLAVEGLVIGLAGALLLSRLIKTMLFGIPPNDPATLAGAVLLLVLVIGAATLGAARRAARIDPATALRQE